MIKRVSEYFRGVKKEVSKVVWLSKVEVLKQLGIVVLFTVVLLGYFGLIDGIVALVGNLF